MLQWRVYLFDHYPRLRDHIPAADSTKPEDDSLQLPSVFTPSQQINFSLTDLATIEYDLREGQAHDALHAVREAIKTFNYNLAFKETHIHGQWANTQAQTFLQLLSKDRVSAADKYRRARAALLKLGLPETDTVLQPLRNDQLWMKNVNEPQKLGETALNDPWIWKVGRPKGLSKQQEADWSEDSTYIISAFDVRYFDTCLAQWNTSNGFASEQIEIATVKRWRLWRRILNVPSFRTPVWPGYGLKWPTAALKTLGARHMPGRR
jgi:hypothetical protein